jgi:hypothetical protein
MRIEELKKKIDLAVKQKRIHEKQINAMIDEDLGKIARGVLGES